MNENSGANSTQGATGNRTGSDDFETVPVGTQERLRRLGIIGIKTAEVLEELADELKNSESINGEWPDDPEAAAAQATHDEWTGLATWLRALCAPPDAAPPEAKPEFPPLEDGSMINLKYPWPTTSEIEP